MAASNKEERVSSNLLQHLILAGNANAAGQTVGHPFDLLKLRLQVQGRGANLTKGERKYKGPIQGLRVIYSEGGVVGLFSAWRISALREWWYSGLRVGMYEPTKEFLGATDPKNTPLYLKITAGLISGTIASTLSNPMDLLKVRFQAAEGEEYRRLPSIWRAFVNLYQTEGVKGMWRGYTANTGRAAGITAVQLSSYDHIKHFLLNVGYFNEGKPLHFLTSFIASLLCIIFTNPIDVIKTRMMGFREHNSVLECGRAILKQEGRAAFYKGALLAWLRLGPHTVVTFMSFEWMRQLFGVRPI